MNHYAILADLCQVLFITFSNLTDTFGDEPKAHHTNFKTALWPEGIVLSDFFIFYFF